MCVAVGPIEWISIMSSNYSMVSHFSMNFLVLTLQGNPTPPPGVSMVESFYEKLTNAFSKATYLDIIWSFF